MSHTLNHPIWFTFHMISYMSEHTLVYRNKDPKKFIQQFIEQIVASKIINPIIQVFLEKNPIELNTDLFEWSIDCHNYVNVYDDLPQISKASIERFFDDLNRILNPKWIKEDM